MASTEPQRQLGKYTILRELGRGGFATVYLAQDTVLRRTVALKVMHPVLLTDPAFVARFESEARAIAQFEHPRIAMIYELEYYEGRLCIAMQLMPGGSLVDRIQQYGPLAYANAVRAMGDVAEALDHAHAAGFIHRDVKPSNILFNARGDAVLTDFGLVKAAESSVIARTTMGGLLGTPAYMAPEVWEGQGDSIQTDVYALGCVLYEMLIGAVLFKGDTPPAVMLRHFQPRTYPEQWPEGTPPGVAQLLNRALAREPAARFPSAGALARALSELDPQNGAARAVSGPAESASPPPTGESAKPAEPAAAPAPAQAGLSPSVVVPGALRLIANISLAWIAGWIASIWLAWVLEGGQGGLDAANVSGWAGGWAAAGLFAGIWLRRTAPVAQKWPTVGLAIGWPVCMTIATILAAIIYSAQPERGLDTLAVGTAVAAGIAGIAIRGHNRAVTWSRIALLALGWAIGWRLAEVINNDGSGGGPWHGVLFMFSYGYNFHDAFALFPQLVPAHLIFGGMLGAALGAGLVWLFGKLQALRSNRT